MRIGDGQYEPNVPMSGRIRAEIGPDGTPQMIEGRILLEKGLISEADDPLTRIVVDRAEFTLNWDASRQALMIPFQVVSGGTRMTLLAQLDTPREAGGPWGLRVTGGTVVLASGPDDPEALVLNRFLMRCASIPTSTGSTSSRARSATRNSVSRFPGASIIPTSRASPWELPATACRWRR